MSDEFIVRVTKTFVWYYNMGSMDRERAGAYQEAPNVTDSYRGNEGRLKTSLNT